MPQLSRRQLFSGLALTAGAVALSPTTAAATWDADSAEEWDGQTLDSWLRSHTVNPQTRAVASGAFEALFGAEAREISLLYALWYVACAGDEQNPGTGSSATA